MFVLLDSFANYIDAHIVLGRMQEENIQCWLKDENTVTLDPILTNAVGGIKLMDHGFHRFHGCITIKRN